jgi:exonuclease VII small subunit
MLSLGAWLDHLKTHTEELHQEGAALDQTFKTYLEAFQMAAILFEEISCSTSWKTSFA